MANDYTLDTNVYIAALRDRARLDRLSRYLVRAGPRLRLHAVVAMELRAGAKNRGQAEAVDALVKPYEQRDRVLVPSFDAYTQAGRVLADLSTYERYVQGDWGSALSIDVIIATSCREAHTVLVTENVKHFAAIQRQLRGFRYVEAEVALTAITKAGAQKG